MKNFRSVAIWPPEAKVPGDKSTDDHETRRQASSVCDMLERDGLGGEHKVFPIRTYYEQIEPEAAADNKINPLNIATSGIMELGEVERFEVWASGHEDVNYPPRVAYWAITLDEAVKFAEGFSSAYPVIDIVRTKTIRQRVEYGQVWTNHGSVQQSHRLSPPSEELEQG